MSDRTRYLGSVRCRRGIHRGPWVYLDETDCTQCQQCTDCGEQQTRIEHEIIIVLQIDRCDVVCSRCEEEFHENER